MKFPKNRANLYLVERWTYKDNKGVIVGAFSNLIDADEFKAACEQEWEDKASHAYPPTFNVAITTFYG